MGPELRRGNLAAGISSAAHRLAGGIIAGGCLYGADLKTLAVGAAFFALGVATLLGFQVLHRKLTRYADDQEIRGDNAAAALSNGGLGVALAIIIATPPTATSPAGRIPCAPTPSRWRWRRRCTRSRQLL
jgi:uncharacterized membrane protein YjfL (UPF0719 family)